MASPGGETPSAEMSGSYFPERQSKHAQQLQFPFRHNAIARKARSPGPSEIAYQLRNQHGAAEEPQIPAVVEERRPSGDSVATTESDGGLPPGPTRDLMTEQIAQEQHMAKVEEQAEMEKVEEEESPTASLMLGPTIGSSPNETQSLAVEHDRSQSTTSSAHRDSVDNVAAALHEGDEVDEIIEDRMEPNSQEKKRVRREKLGERLQEVFGLEEREEVLEEMRCWLLRSVSK